MKTDGQRLAEAVLSEVGIAKDWVQGHPAPNWKILKKGETSEGKKVALITPGSSGIEFKVLQLFADAPEYSLYMYHHGDFVDGSVDPIEEPDLDSAIEAAKSVALGMLKEYSVTMWKKAFESQDPKSMLKRLAPEVIACDSEDEACARKEADPWRYKMAQDAGLPITKDKRYKVWTWPTKLRPRPGTWSPSRGWS